MALNQCGSSVYGRHREITLKTASFFFCGVVGVADAKDVKNI